LEDEAQRMIESIQERRSLAEEEKNIFNEKGEINILLDEDQRCDRLQEIQDNIKAAKIRRREMEKEKLLDKDEEEKDQEAIRFWIVKLKSGEVRKVSRDACATIGAASNPAWQHRQLGKAGRSRWLNIRPTVRGVAMNACDHPHGGGRGKSKGNKIPVSPWGKQAKSGKRTRKRSRPNTFVVEARPRNHGKRRGK